MSKNLLKFLAVGVCTLGLMSSCGEDRTGEYLALVGTQKWMYQTMQENYLFYEDLPDEDRLNFFAKPQQFLDQVISNKDRKNGYKFSHVDSIYVQPKSRADIRPSFGLECALIRIQNGTEAFRILYTEKDSPAEEAQLKRGDWIIAVNGKKINQNTYGKLIARPTEACSFTMGSFNGTDFDTLQVVQMPSPRVVAENDFLETHFVESGNRKAFYMLYNKFGKDDKQVMEVFKQLAGQQVDDIILDLRYNPGGYVHTSLIMGSNLAPTEAIHKPLVKMKSNDKLNQTEEHLIDTKFMAGGAPLSYQNLYVITSEQTASAAELLINGLRPFMKGRLWQVGMPTYGKNVAQRLFLNKEHPMLEFWLTTFSLSNSEDFGDYFTNGLKPDFLLEETFGGELGELGTSTDGLMVPILYHMAQGAFPQEKDEKEESTVTSRSSMGIVLYHSIADKPKELKLEEGFRK